VGGDRGPSPDLPPNASRRGLRGGRELIDVLAGERHFVDHCQAVWAELPPDARGTFYVPPALLGYATARGLEAEAVDRIPAGGPLLVSSYGDLKRSRVGDRGPKAFLEHGAGQSYGGDPATARHHSYPGGEDRDDVGLFLVPNDHAARRYQVAYPSTPLAIVGSPILDGLPALEPGPTVVALGWHWDCRLNPETYSAIHEFARDLPALARHFSVIGHGHPRRSELTSRYRRAGIEHVASFRDVCRRASLYVADNTSTLFEFAATGRPVVVLNARRYRRDVRHGLRFWDAAGVGPNVDRPRDLVDVIARALEDPPEFREKREAALELVYQPRHGGAKLAAAALLEWASRP
jgi:hypothetical protein